MRPRKTKKASARKTAKIDWSRCTITQCGGIAATIATLHRTRGPDNIL